MTDFQREKEKRRKSKKSKRLENMIEGTNISSDGANMFKFQVA